MPVTLDPLPALPTHSAFSALSSLPQPTVLVIDDVPENLLVISELLREDGYAVRVARSGPAGLNHARQSPQPDLILLDVMMPRMDGYEVLRELRADPGTAEVPVIFVTARGEEVDEEHGLALGAADYLRKPIRPLVLLARVRAQIQARQARRAMACANRILTGELGDRMVELLAARRAGIRALAHLAEARDPETGHHILRTQAYVHALATAMRDRPECPAELDDRMIDWLAESAPLHDIGKVGVPDHILLKPGPLDEDEWRVMRTHTTIGARAIEHAERDVGHASDFLRVARQVAQSHHERWDGAGYPQGLAGEAIPLAARIMAVADVFDALITERPYKRALPLDEAYGAILADSGTRFDPQVVRAFERAFDQLACIAREHMDPVSDAGSPRA